MSSSVLKIIFWSSANKTEVITLFILLLSYKSVYTYRVKINKADVHSVQTGMDPSDYQELFQRLLVGVSPILEQYHMSFYLVITQQLQLCHLK